MLILSDNAHLEHKSFSRTDSTSFFGMFVCVPRLVKNLEKIEVKNLGTHSLLVRQNTSFGFVQAFLNPSKCRNDKSTQTIFSLLGILVQGKYYIVMIKRRKTHTLISYIPSVCADTDI